MHRDIPSLKHAKLYSSIVVAVVVVVVVVAVVAVVCQKCELFKGMTYFYTIVDNVPVLVAM